MHPLICCWFPLVYFLFAIIFFNFDWFSFTFCNSLLKFSLNSLILLSSGSVFGWLLWTLYLVNCLYLFCSVHFLKFCLVLLFGRYSFVSSFCLILCVCVYVLVLSSISPSLERVSLCRWCPVGPNGTVPAGHQSRCSRFVSSVGCVCPLVVFVPQLLLMPWWSGLVPAWLSMRPGQVMFLSGYS